VRSSMLLVICVVLCCKVYSQSVDISVIKRDVLEKLQLERDQQQEESIGATRYPAIEAYLREKSQQISALIARTQARIIEKSPNSLHELSRLSTAFAELDGEGDSNPFVSGFYCSVRGMRYYVSIVTSRFYTQAMPISFVYLNEIPLAGVTSSPSHIYLNDMRDTIAHAVQIPSRGDNQCLFMVRGQATRKMQYHERAALYRFGRNGLQLLWVSDLMHRPEYSIEPEKVVIKQSVNLVGGDFSTLASEFPEFQGHAIRTLLISAGSASELAPTLVPISK
jgi:hypothetical protein